MTAVYAERGVRRHGQAGAAGPDPASENRHIGRPLAVRDGSRGCYSLNLCGLDRRSRDVELPSHRPIVGADWRGRTEWGHRSTGIDLALLP
jgi:hypothetical protein